MCILQIVNFMSILTFIHFFSKILFLMTLVSLVSATLSPIATLIPAIKVCRSNARIFYAIKFLISKPPVNWRKTLSSNYLH